MQQPATRSVVAQMLAQDMPDETEPAIVEMVFFGPRAEEIIGCPLDALINDDSGVGAFIPLRIAMLYGKQFELWVSVSSMSLQSASITYLQVDAIIEPEQQECQQQSALPEKPRSPAQHEHTDTPAVDVPILPTPDKASQILSTSTPPDDLPSAQMIQSKDWERADLYHVQG